MDHSIAVKWVQALRSGEYQQGKKALRTQDSFCCLGVLCELHRQAEGGEWVPGLPETEAPAGRQEYHATNGDWDHSLLPEAVQEWAGLQSVSPGVGRNELPHCNDQGWTFSQLADLIDNNWEQL